MKIGRSSAKRYGCIFTCLASRAVHLELVESLSTDAFLGAFFRFLCSRGFPVKHIFSDNGTNFVGAVTKLCRPNAKNMMNERRVLRNIASLGIEWHFNAPASSHAGGVWERLIRSVRKVLTALADDRHLFRTPSDYGLWTNFIHVEAILNNRPLTPVSADPDDIRALTPMRSYYFADRTIDKNCMTNRENKFVLRSDLTKKPRPSSPNEYKNRHNLTHLATVLTVLIFNKHKHHCSLQ